MLAFFIILAIIYIFLWFCGGYIIVFGIAILPYIILFYVLYKFNASVPVSCIIIMIFCGFTIWTILGGGFVKIHNLCEKIKSKFSKID